MTHLGPTRTSLLRRIAVVVAAGALAVVSRPARPAAPSRTPCRRRRASRIRHSRSPSSTSTHRHDPIPPAARGHRWLDTPDGAKCRWPLLEWARVDRQL